MHTDASVLGLLALGEPAGTEQDRAHLAGCENCTRELAALRRLVEQGRNLERTLGPEPIETPSRRVWARIRTDLDFDPTLEAPGAPVPELSAYALLSPTEPDWSQASATAELATDERGRRILQVALLAELPSSGLRQAWLVHRDDPSRRQTVGILDGPHGVWTIDHSIDLEAFSVLEISQQQAGESDHSGRVVVRGELTLTS